MCIECGQKNLFFNCADEMNDADANDDDGTDDKSIETTETTNY